MLRNGRPEEPSFEAGESLFFRYGKGQFVEGFLAIAAIRFPKTSVNRGRFSEAEDVLFSPTGAYDGLGAVEFKVGDIPPRVQQPQGPTYLFFMHHDPLEENYSHSEIWSDQEPNMKDYREPSKTVKMSFRIALSKKITEQNIRIKAVREIG